MQGLGYGPLEASAKADLAEALAKSERRITKHMNEDHADSLLAWAKWYAKLDSAVSAEMATLSTNGFVLTVILADGTMRSDVLIPYNKPLKSAGEVRKLAVVMHFEAYNKLGFGFKWSQSFYSRAAKQAWTHMPAQVRWTAVTSLAMAVFGAAVAARRLRW